MQRLRNSVFLLALLTISPLAFNLQAQSVDDVWNDLVARGLKQDGLKDYAHAETTLVQALHEAERFGAEDPRVATTLTNLGLNYRHQKKFAEAEGAYRKALAIIEKQNDADSSEVADATFNVALTMVDQGHAAPAIPLIQTTLNIFESALGGFHERTGDALCLLGDADRMLKKFTDAERPLRRCADIRQANGGMDDLEFAEALHSLALTYMGDGKYALAEPRFTLAEKIREKVLGITSPLLAQTMMDHAELLVKLGREKEAARLRAMAGAILKGAKH